MQKLMACGVFALICAAAQAQTPTTSDASPHTVQFVSVTKDVKLEVLDWGGSGSPMIFLPGLGDTAHVFDTLAPKFTAKHHVFGITRRGGGGSSAPPATDDNYDADRLGDDVLVVMDALKLDRPVLVGHSIAGQELSSIGSRHPEKVAGLIYLDAAGTSAFYVPGSNAMAVDIAVMRRDLTQLPQAARSASRSLALIKEMQETMPSLEVGLDQYAELLKNLPDLPPAAQTIQRQIFDAIQANPRKYTAIGAPALAIIAVPHACAPNCEKPSAKAAAEADRIKAEAFEAAYPKIHVVRLAYAKHDVWLSNEAEVLRAMTDFMDSLPK